MDKLALGFNDLKDQVEELAVSVSQIRSGSVTHFNLGRETRCACSWPSVSGRTCRSLGRYGATFEKSTGKKTPAEPDRGGSEEPDEEFVLLAVNRRIVFLTVCLSPGASPLTITSCAANQQPGHDHQGPPGWLWDA
jgi:hypothetical protein